PSGLEFHQLSTLLTINRKLLYFDDLAIETGGSNLDIPVLKFDFEAFNRFKRFSYEVDLQFSSRQSELKLADLFYFVPGTGSVLDRITIDGSVNGKLNDLIGDDLLVTFDDQSSLAFDFVMIGLPDFRNTFLDFSFRDLNTSVLAVNDLFGTPGDSVSQFLYPWINLGYLDFTGHFTGYPDQFVASGLLATDMGRMVMDLSFQPDSVHGVDFHGRLRTNDFRLGEFLNQERDLEQLDMDIFTDGNLYKGQISADLEGTIDTLELYDYAYSNITLDGAFTNNTFDGGFSISDPNIKMDFQGMTDFSGEVPVYKFTANVARARPYYLNIIQSDPNYFASFLIETDLSGRTLDELNGELKLVNSLFEKTDAQIQLYDVTIKARNTPDASLVQVRSDLLDADLTGQYKLTSLPGSFRNLADHYLNVIPNSEPVRDTSHYFVYNAEIKHINPLLDFFIPAVRIGDRSSISGTYDPQNMDISLTGGFPTLQVANNCWHNASVDTHIKSGRLESEFRSDSMTFGKNYSVENQHFMFSASNDTAHLDIGWDNVSGPEYRGEISLSGTFQPDSLKDRGFMIDLEPGTLSVSGHQWNVQQANMLIRRKYLSINN
ncbi:MAG: hypothetical protein KAT15_07280, partial [Bacteroidales bacterium]|nr:hypothetical protein [Bacteroidales bacterium]